MNEARGVNPGSKANPERPAASARSDCAASRDPEDPKDKRASRELLDPMDFQVHRVFKARSDPVDLKERKVIQELLVLLVRLVFKE